MKQLVKSATRALGYELVEVKQRPMTTFLGLTHVPIQTIIDVGANRGQFSQYISDFFPQAQIHAFEPLPGPCSELREWGQVYKKRLTVHNVAVGNESGTTQIQHHIDFTPSSSVLESVPGYAPVAWQETRVEQIDVRVTTLDDAFPNAGAGLEKPILLKLDVQGFEDRVLIGAKLLLPYTSIVVVEYCSKQLYKDQADFDDIYRKIYEAGLKYVGALSQYHDHNGGVVYSDLVFGKLSEISREDDHDV